jgi:hypothetical protein
VDRLPSSLVVDRDGSVAAVNLRGARLTTTIDRLISSGARTDDGSGKPR